MNNSFNTKKTSKFFNQFNNVADEILGIFARNDSDALEHYIFGRDSYCGDEEAFDSLLLIRLGHEDAYMAKLITIANELMVECCSAMLKTTMMGFDSPTTRKILLIRTLKAWRDLEAITRMHTNVVINGGDAPVYGDSLSNSSSILDELMFTEEEVSELVSNAIISDELIGAAFIVADRLLALIYNTVLWYDCHDVTQANRKVVQKSLSDFQKKRFVDALQAAGRSVNHLHKYVAKDNTRLMWEELIGLRVLPYEQAVRLPLKEYFRRFSPVSFQTTGREIYLSAFSGFTLFGRTFLKTMSVYAR